jgi:hypothetical protein
MMHDRRSTFIVALLCFAMAQAARSAVVEIPFETSPRRSLILIEVRIDDHPRIFVMDTGSTWTLVNRRIMPVTEFEIRKSRFQNGGSSVVFEGKSVAAAVAIGTQTWSEWKVLATDLDLLTETYGRSIDGVLGQDILRQFDTVTIDYVLRKITLNGR